jgi:hypothetical protein
VRLVGTPARDIGFWLAPIVAGVALAFFSGGYFIASWGVASIVLLGLLAIRLWIGEASVGGPLGIAALVGWIGLGAWQGLSAGWAGQASAAVATMNQTILYAAAFALVLVGRRRAQDLRLLLHAVCLACAVVVAYSLCGRLLPTLVSGDEGGRLAQPVTYWNGLGALAALGVALGIAGAGNPAHRLLVRAAYAALVPMFLLALLLTFSRGALVTLIAGLMLLIALAPGRIESIVSMVIGVGLSIPLLLAANADDAIATLYGGVPPADDAGRGIALFLVLTMVAVAVSCAVASLPLPRLASRHRLVIGSGAAAVAVTACAVLVATYQPEEGAAGWVEGQFESFKTFDEGARVGADTVAERLAVAAGSGRWQIWGVAVEQFRSSPIAGTGAGDYRFRWDRERDIDLFVRNAHSLPLEVLGESGLIGLVLLLTPLGAVLVAVVAARRRAAPPEVVRDLTTAVAAGAVVALHMGGDWDWQLPAVSLPAIVMGAGALKAARLATTAAPPAGLGTRAALTLLTIVSIWMVAGAVASDAALRDARDAAASGDLPTALAHADRAHRLNRPDPEPFRLRGNVLADLGQEEASDAAFAAAVARSPRDWLTFADWAQALRRRGDIAGARLAARRARALNPLDPRPRLLLESLASS